MQKKDLFILQETLNKLSDIKSTKFGYFVLKNLKMIEPELEILRKMAEPGEGLKAYETKRVGICNEFCEKDEAGEAKTVLGPDGRDQYVITDREAFDAQLKLLRDEFKADFDTEETKIKEMNTIMMEDAGLELYKIKLDNIPDGLSAQDLLALDDLIE